MNCKKVPIDREQLDSKLNDVTKVLVTKGRKLLELDPTKDREQILDISIGRSGNLRAPSVRNKKLLIVGFSADAYSELL